MAVVQYTFTHKQYTERHKTKSIKINTKVLEGYGSAELFTVVTGATKTISKSLRKYLSNILEKHKHNLQVSSSSS